MGTLPELLNNPGRYALITIAGVTVLYITIMAYILYRRKAAVKDFRSHDPDTAKVWITAAAAGNLMVRSINGGTPGLFSEGLRTAFYLSPGESVLSCQYAWNRPGPLCKTLTTIVGPTDLTVRTESGKVYRIGFSHRTRTFKFTES
jgi:hypothetical protein